MSETEKGWGGKRAGAGRPVGSTGSYKPADQLKNKRIVVVCTEEQNNTIKELARREGLTVSAYILKKALS